MQKKTNKILSVLLAVLLLFSAIPITSFAISNGDSVNVTEGWMPYVFYTVFYG